MNTIIKEIQKVNIQPNEFFLVKFNEKVPKETIANTMRHFRKELPGIKFVAYTEDFMKLKVVKQL